MATAVTSRKMTSPTQEVLLALKALMVVCSQGQRFGAAGAA